MALIKAQDSVPRFDSLITFLPGWLVDERLSRNEHEQEKSNLSLEPPSFALLPPGVACRCFLASYLFLSFHLLDGFYFLRSDERAQDV